MAASAPVDVVGGLTVTTILNCTNTNSNTASVAFDMSPYVGTLFVVVNGGNAISGTALQPRLVVSADTNTSNGSVYSTLTNVTGTAASSQVANVDLRAVASASKKYLFLDWLIGGAASANGVSLDATVIGQKKVSS